MNDERSELGRRAAVHAALGDPARLAIVDALLLGEASPSELQTLLEMPSNLLAHHVRVLERAGVVSRHRSEGDRRRTYLSLAPDALPALGPTPLTRSAPNSAGDSAGGVVGDVVRVVFVCTENSARSQLAAALWTVESDLPASSAGTHPARAVHPGAVAVARRRAVPLVPAPPRHIDDVLHPDDIVITVCDAAHEELGAGAAGTSGVGGRRLHWSIPDPARTGAASAFERTVDQLVDRISRLAPVIQAAIRPAARPNPGPVT